MTNFIFVSPNFPRIYSKFVRGLKENGVNVLGIGDTPYNDTEQELRDYITEYYYIPNLADINKINEAVGYFERKYGHIDFLESNNEYWLEQDALVRETFHIDTGFYPKDMEKIKFKSKMKEYFKKAGVKTARYILVDTLENSLKFASEVGYPLFVKPDNGVGAAASYKLKDEEALRNFHNQELHTTYIMEEYIDGELMSFDGVCDLDGNVVFAVNEVFPMPIAEVVNSKSDVYYYCNADMPESFREIGKAVVKSFGISKRCFHIEFFKLKKAKAGLGKKGDIIALETNMRSPGGNTPDLIALSINANYYKIYADVIAFNESRQDMNKEKYIAMSVSRRDELNYVHTNEEIYAKYGPYIAEHDRYSPEIAVAMGNDFYFGRFKNLEEALKFKDFIMAKK